jgi:hypothetical protein
MFLGNNGDVALGRTESGEMPPKNFMFVTNADLFGKRDKKLSNRLFSLVNWE